MSSDSKQVMALLDLAWRNCERDIFAVLHMVIGMVLFILAWFTFSILNVAKYQSDVTTTSPVDIAGTQLGIIIMSFMEGFGNTVTFLIFVAIIICLFEYALSFTTICYYYDNKSWAVPRLIRDICNSIISHIRHQQDEDANLDQKHREHLEDEIHKIRTVSETPKIE